MKKKTIVIRALLTLCLAALLTAAAFVAWLSIKEYRPQAVEAAERIETFDEDGTAVLREGDSLRIATLNTGYACLDKDHDFFMDGGKNVNSRSKPIVEKMWAEWRGFCRRSTPI